MLCLNTDAATKKPVAPITRGKIISVDLKTNMVTLEAAPGQPPQQCVLNDQSTVEVNDKTVTPKQIKTGLYIRSVRLDSSNPPVIEDIDLTNKGS
jgi:hypothetical protein